MEKAARGVETLRREADKENTGPTHFSKRPKDIKAYLDRFVISQDDAKKVLAVAICDHYNHIDNSFRVGEQLGGGEPGSPSPQPFTYLKQNILLLGPTGVGKTYLIRKLAKVIGVPFVKADATRFSETGYMGANVDDLIRELVQQAGGDIEAAQRGIVYLDEIDKLATSPGHPGRDVSGRGVQTGLLKLLEDGEVDLNAGNDIASQMQAMFNFQKKGRRERQVVKTENILFIASGAFDGLAGIIRKRLGRAMIGYPGSRQDPAQSNADAEDSAILCHLATEDLVKFGLEPEFVGRLPIRVACAPLSADDLRRILTESEDSLLHQYSRAFAAYGIELMFTPDALAAVSAVAARQGTGARALMSVLETCLRDFKYHLPSTDVRTLTIDAEAFRDPAAALSRLMEDQGLAAVRKFLLGRMTSGAHPMNRVPPINLRFSDGLLARMRSGENQAFGDEKAMESLFGKFAEEFKLCLALLQAVLEPGASELDLEISEGMLADPRPALEDIVRRELSRSKGTSEGGDPVRPH